MPCSSRNGGFKSHEQPGLLVRNLLQAATPLPLYVHASQMFIETRMIALDHGRSPRVLWHGCKKT